MLTITGSGRITQDFNLLQSKSGMYYVKFNIVSNNKKDSTVTFLSCIAFNNVAKHLVNAKVHVGSSIYFTGNFEMQYYTNKKGLTCKNPTVLLTSWEYCSSFNNKKYNKSQSKDDYSNDELKLDIDDDDLPF